MRKVILTKEHSGVINDDSRRVVGAGEERNNPAEVFTAKEVRPITVDEVRLFTVSEAARILHVSRNAIYALWRDGQLDFWRINGTMTTNLTAIRDFLERTKGGVDKSVWE